MESVLSHSTKHLGANSISSHGMLNRGFKRTHGLLEAPRKVAYSNSFKQGELAEILYFAVQRERPRRFIGGHGKR